MFDTMIIGQVSVDRNVDYDGREEIVLGGAVLASGYIASALGERVAVVPKNDLTDIVPEKEFEECKNVTVFARKSKENVHMENVYHTADRERRDCRCTAAIDPYTPEDIPDEPAKVYHLAGLIVGDIPGNVIEACSKKGDVAVDVQCMMRRRFADNHLEVLDWEEKMKYLPMCRYLKTDAAEAEQLTGTSDREEAAKLLYKWGAKEIMITHNTEVIVYDGKQIYRDPLKPRSLIGRTGRGDTTFAAYLVERQTKSIPEALLMAAAGVSLQMETPGPYKGTRKDIENFIDEFYK